MVQNEPPSLPLLSESLSWRSDSIKTPVTVWKREPGRAGPIRLVVGFLRIVLVVENVPFLGWHILDYFPLVSASDGGRRHENRHHARKTCGSIAVPPMSWPPSATARSCTSNSTGPSHVGSCPAADQSMIAAPGS